MPVDSRLKDYDALLDANADISIYLTGKPAESRKKALAADFLTRIVMGATTLRIVLGAPEVALGSRRTRFPLYDFASANALVRPLLEAYANMHYITDETVTAEESELRLLLWEHHGCKEILAAAKAVGIDSERLADVRRRKKELISEIRAQPAFAGLPQSERDRRLDIGYHRELVAKCEAAGIHRSWASFSHNIQSQYVHTGPWALQQIGDVRSASEARSLLAATVQGPIIVLALTLKKIASLFRDHPAVTATHARVAVLADAYCHLASLDQARARPDVDRA